MQSFDIDPRACHRCSLWDGEKVSEREEEREKVTKGN